MLKSYVLQIRVFCPITVGEYLGSLPWTLPSDEEKKTLDELQEKTQPLLRGLGELVWADKEEKYAPIVGEALERLALASRRPAYVGSLTEVVRPLGSTPSSSRCTTLAYWPTSTVGQTIFGFSSRYNLLLQEQMTKTLPLFFPSLGIASIPTLTNFLRDSIPDGAWH